MGCSPSLAQTRRTKIAATINGKTKVTFNDCHEENRGISEEEKQIVKRHWEVLSSDIKALGTRVFLQIFQEHPEIKQLFPCRDVEDDQLISSEEFKGHAYRFMQAVGAVVDNIDNLDKTMSSALMFLGKQHTTFPGVKAYYFDDFYYAITKVWKDLLGKRYTTENAKAWGHVFSYIMEMLKKGFNLKLNDNSMICLR